MGTTFNILDGHFVAYPFYNREGHQLACLSRLYDQGVTLGSVSSYKCKA